MGWFSNEDTTTPIKFKYISPNIAGSSDSFNCNEYFAISEEDKLYIVLSKRKCNKDDTVEPTVFVMTYPIHIIEKTLSGRIYVEYRGYDGKMRSRELEKTISGKILSRSLATWLAEKPERPFIPQGHPDFDMLICLFD